MKKFSLASSSAVLALGLSLSPNAAAQSPDATYIVHGIANARNPAALVIVQAINEFFSYVKTYVAYDWQEKQPNLAEITEPKNILSTQLTMIQNASVNSLSADAIASIIGPISPRSPSSSSISASLASNFANDVLPPSAQQGMQLKMTPKSIQLCGNNMFNFESLMGYSSYGKQVLSCNPKGGPQDVSRYARDYIQYVTNQGRSINNFSLEAAINSTPQLLTKEQAEKLMLLPEWTDYTLARRNILSIQSAAISNLNYLYNQRAPDANGNSPESTADYISSWRTQNVNGWYDTMSTTADLPILLRENLFIMAEIQRDLHEMRKENQRQLAATSIMLAQNVLLGRQALNIRFTALQAKIRQLKGGAAGYTLPGIGQ